MNALLLIRRIHLYLGMFLIPWMIAFGISSLPLNHTSWNRPVTWTLIEDHEYHLDVPPEAGLRDVGRRMLADAGLSGGVYVSRPNPGRIAVNHPTFREVERLTYDIERQRLTIERRSNLLPQFLGTMHTRAGYDLDSPGNIFWAAMVDVLCAGLMLWIASGLVMWWQLRGSRRWGWLALLGGAACFAMLVGAL